MSKRRLTLLILAFSAIILLAEENIQLEKQLSKREEESLNSAPEQNTEEVFIDSTNDEFSYKKKIPMKAAALSMFIPGAGQFYNGSYWKAGAVVVLEGSLIGLTVYHHIMSESKYDDFQASGSQLLYQEYVDYYNKRQSDLWWLGAVIFLSTIDAFVDAHLYDFEDKKQKIHLKFEDNMLSLQYNF